MLVDTGASTTCISLGVAHQLGLMQVGTQRVRGVSGIHENAMFAGELVVAVTDGAITAQIEILIGVTAVPELDQHVAFLNPSIRIIGLLGRDILRHMRMIYDGPAGRLEFVVDWPSLHAREQRQP